jgi:hypothetical protein
MRTILMLLVYAGLVTLGTAALMAGIGLVLTS